MDSAFFENSLSDDDLKKFDYIIMNPPYAGSLHLKILERALSYLKDGGTLVCLHPNTFRLHLGQYINQKGEFVATHLKSYTIIPHNEANNYFSTGNAIEELIIGVYDNKVCREPPFNKIAISIYNKIRKNTLDAANGWDQIRVKRELLKDNYVLFDVWNGSLVFDENRGVKYGLQFQSKEEASNFIDYFDNLFIKKFLMKFNGIPSIKVIKSKDFSHKWTNEELSDYIGLNEEETNYLKNNNCW